jgi:23S rRNA (guanosine2251-2'-O)-methyltransferase
MRSCVGAVNAKSAYLSWLPFLAHAQQHRNLMSSNKPFGKPFRPRDKQRGGRSFGAERETQRLAPDRSDGLQVLYGIHSVVEALRNPRRKLSRLIATENGAMRLAEAGPMPIEAVIVKPDDIGKQLTPDAVHQGVLLLAEPLEPIDAEDISDTALVLALDQITDPHNVGAILRTAAAFGVDAIISTERHSPQMTGVLTKAASGALEHVPFVFAKNLGNTLESLKDRGFLTLGLDSEADHDIADIKFQRPLCLVLGAEGKGLRQRTRDIVERMVRLDMPGAIKSLNVSNAAAISLFAVTQGLKRRE